MSKQKVSELPQEERAALIKEANELGINGVFDNFNVETLQNKIAEKKNEKEQEKADDEEHKNQNSENIPEEKVQKADEETAEEDNAENQANEETKEESQTNNEEANAGDEQCDGEADPLPRNEVKEYKICHICRSKVVDGKCTGCGFEGR